MPKALDINWPVLQVEFSHGVSIPELARKYGISEGTIKARSARHKWMLTRPEEVKQAVAAQQSCSATGLQLALKQGALNAGTTLAERGQAYASRVFDKVSRLVESAEIAPPKNFKDLEIADKIARRSAGLDTAEMAVNTVIGIGGMDFAPGTQQAEIVEIPSSQNAPVEGEWSES